MFTPYVLYEHLFVCTLIKLQNFSQTFVTLKSLTNYTYLGLLEL